ncbi:MAG: hypothetical protein KatS3mg109_0037 [Pirellulaceae bacterium]|nr:MAG: hypothetical protein KatS3mg109_0037 [Pirellulaceae bacterium]
MFERQRVRLVPVSVRKGVREIARVSYIEAGGDVDRAIYLTKQRVKARYGSILTALLVLSAVLSVVVELIKLWSILNVKRPSRAIDDASRKVGLF